MIEGKIERAKRAFANEVIEEIDFTTEYNDLEWLYDVKYTDLEDNIFELHGDKIENILENVKEMIIKGLVKETYKDATKESYIIEKVREKITEKDCNEYNFLKLDVEIKKVFRTIYQHYPNEEKLADLRAMFLSELY